MSDHISLSIVTLFWGWSITFPYKRYNVSILIIYQLIVFLAGARQKEHNWISDRVMFHWNLVAVIGAVKKTMVLGDHHHQKIKAGPVINQRGVISQMLGEHHGQMGPVEQAVIQAGAVNEDQGTDLYYCNTL